MKLSNFTKYLVGVVILIFTSISFAGDKQCSSTWDPDADGGPKCVAQQITNGFAEAPSAEYMRRYTTRAACLGYCDVECTGSDTVALCVQRRSNSTMKICRDKNFFEDFGYPIPQTSNDCSTVDVD